MYHGIINNIIGEASTVKVGKRIILPSSFIRGSKDMHNRYMKVMTLVQCFGKPNIFLTMIFNLSWRKILNELEPHKEVHNRSDLVVRVFQAKLED